MAKYRNAAELLPPRLLTAVQHYAAGLQLYVPRPVGRLGWGERSGTREALARRNETIRELHRQGTSVDKLMGQFHLGYDSIRKIVAGGQAVRRDTATDQSPCGSGADSGKNTSTRTRA